MAAEQRPESDAIPQQAASHHRSEPPAAGRPGRTWPSWGTFGTIVPMSSASWTPPDLRGTVAVVTGASRGAGRGVAAVLGETGATVYVTGRSVRGAATTEGLPGTIEETPESCGHTVWRPLRSLPASCAPSACSLHTPPSPSTCPPQSRPNTWGAPWRCLPEIPSSCDARARCSPRETLPGSMASPTSTAAGCIPNRTAPRPGVMDRSSASRSAKSSRHRPRASQPPRFKKPRERCGNP